VTFLCSREKMRQDYRTNHSVDCDQPEDVGRYWTMRQYLAYDNVELIFVCYRLSDVKVVDDAIASALRCAAVDNPFTAARNGSLLLLFLLKIVFSSSLLL
jgi:hypothetical protein